MKKPLAVALVGPTASGKSSLAVKIANREVPVKLLSKEIYLLDLAGVVAGTQFRGQFESRIKAIIDEAKKRRAYSPNGVNVWHKDRTGFYI